MNMRDLVGSSNLPRFSPGMQDEQMIAWLLEAQTVVAASCGISLTVADLGAPKGGDGVGAYLTHLHNASPPQQQQEQFLPPPQQQFQQQQFQQQQFQQQQFQPQQQSAQPDVYVVESILDLKTNPSGMATHFFVQWANRGMEEASWEAADDIQTAAPRAVAEFKQQLMSGQQRRPPAQQQFQPQQQQFQPQPPPYQPQQQQQYQATDLRGNPIRSPQPFSPQAGSPMRPDQEADLAREAARKRNQGSNPFG